jgi:hypothetical protein
MAFTVTVTAFQLSPDETITNAKLNMLGNPTILVTGATTDLSNWSTTPPTEGQMVIWRQATGKWTPENIPVSVSDNFNKIFSWANFT